MSRTSTETANTGAAAGEDAAGSAGMRDVEDDDEIDYDEKVEGKVPSKVPRGRSLPAPFSEMKRPSPWTQFFLFEHGYKDFKNCHKCPETCALLENISASAGCAHCDIKFSLAQPGVSIAPHCGPTNGRLRIHLGVAGTEGATLRVANISGVQWSPGKAFIFDDSFEHEIAHRGLEPRLVLLVDVWHPDLPPSDFPQEVISRPNSVLKNNPAEYGLPDNSIDLRNGLVYGTLVGLVVGLTFMYCYMRYVICPHIKEKRKKYQQTTESAAAAKEHGD